MTVVDLYTVQIIHDGESNFYLMPFEAHLAEMEENLTDLLPPGYSARIRRWDHPEEAGDADSDV